MQGRAVAHLCRAAVLNVIDALHPPPIFSSLASFSPPLLDLARFGPGALTTTCSLRNAKRTSRTESRGVHAVPQPMMHTDDVTVEILGVALGLGRDTSNAQSAGRPKALT